MRLTLKKKQLISIARNLIGDDVDLSLSDAFITHYESIIRRQRCAELDLNG